MQIHRSTETTTFDLVWILHLPSILVPADTEFLTEENEPEDQLTTSQLKMATLRRLSYALRTVEEKLTKAQNETRTTLARNSVSFRWCSPRTSSISTARRSYSPLRKNGNKASRSLGTTLSRINCYRKEPDRSKSSASRTVR